MNVHIPNKLVVVAACLIAAPVLFAAGQMHQKVRQPQPLETEAARRQIVDTLNQRQLLVAPAPQAIAAQHQVQESLPSTGMSAVLRMDESPEDPMTRLAGTGDVVALWLRGTEWSHSMWVVANEDTGMKAHPILTVGVITCLTDTHVTIATRKWFNSRPAGEDQYQSVELIPRDIIYRVQVLGLTGEEFDQDVVVNIAPTAGFLSAP